MRTATKRKRTPRPVVCHFDHNGECYVITWPAPWQHRAWESRTTHAGAMARVAEWWREQR
jgi:hypothetical protein